MKIIRHLVLTAACMVTTLGLHNVYAQDSTAIEFAQTITAADLRKHLEIIASDEFEGRETATRGQKLAADYIAKHFSNLGIPGIVGDTSYYQEIILKQEMWDTVLFKIGASEFVFMKDFYGFSHSNESGSASFSEMVFLGYGINSRYYNDYEKVDVKDKYLLILDGEPTNKWGKSHVTKSKRSSSWSWNVRKKIKAAEEAGALGIFIIVENMEDKFESYGSRIRSKSLRLIDESTASTDDKIPNIFISTRMRDEILLSNGKKIRRLIKKIDRKGKPRHLTITTDISIEVRKEISNIITENVLGYIEGTDLKSELIVVTAHYDHLGIKGDDIYNGADDDGSGTVTLLEIAEAFTKAKEMGFSPRRSVLIMAMTGEEKGLIGSSYYTDNPIFALDNTIANLNVDMIGRTDTFHRNNSKYVYVIGSDRISEDLHQINETSNRAFTQLELDYRYNDPDDPNRFYYRSDHYNFAQKGVPVIFYFTGVHEDYHKPTDTVEKIEFDKLETIARLIFHTAWELVNRDERIKINPDYEAE
ncbi:MAG: M28 family peptidase [Bacteroidetes bacterium]|nr:M28 family peptidase [Bacteroidota bacterium]